MSQINDPNDLTGQGTPGIPPPSNPSNKRLQQTQAQVNEVVDIMRVNVDKVLERDHKLSELDNRADALQAGASQFEASAGKLKRKFWWRNCKMMLILCTVFAIVLIIVIVSFVTNKKNLTGAPDLDQQPNKSTMKSVESPPQSNQNSNLTSASNGIPAGNKPLAAAKKPVQTPSVA